MSNVPIENTQNKWNELNGPVVAAEAAVIAAEAALKAALKAAKDKAVVNATEVEEAQKAVDTEKMRYARIWRRRQDAWSTYTNQLSKDNLREAASCGGLLSPTQDHSNGTDGVPLDQEGFTLEQDGFTLEQAAVNFNIELRTAINELVVARNLWSRNRRNE